MRKALAFVVAVILSCVGGHAALGGDGPEPWRIGEAYKAVTGQNPEAEHYKALHYSNWSSYGDLCNKVRAKWTNQGAAYVFIKPNQAGRQGHIGWGIMLDDGTYLCGSTENPMDYQHPERALYIEPGKDNGFWMKNCTTEQEMLQTMATPVDRGSSGYWHYKSTTVLNRKASAGRQAAEACRGAGFNGVGNNCLDQTVRVLSAYGTGDSDHNFGRVLPVINQLRIGDMYVVVPGWTKITPNDWFNHFGKIVNGQVAANVGIGERLPGVGTSLVSFATKDAWFGFQEMSLKANRNETGMIRAALSDHVDAQQWWVNPAPHAPGYYFISNKEVHRDAENNLLVLDVPGGSSECVYIGLWAYHGGDNQLWALEGWPAENPDRWAIRNKMTNQYLTLAGGNTAEGTGLCQYKDVNHYAQRWFFR